LVSLAENYPGMVMDVVGTRLLDPQKRLFFALHRFEGLFEAIGLGEVQRWLAENGSESVRYIAHQSETPHLKNGKPFIPPVTDWVMSQFGADERVFRDFCTGRHALEVQVGHPRERREELQRTVGPFLDHALPWVRQWAEWELQENERDAALHDYMDDRWERT
jgi:hypothetical protein